MSIFYSRRELDLFGGFYGTSIETIWQSGNNFYMRNMAGFIKDAE